MTTKGKEKNTELPIPKTFSEFYPKNYIKKNPKQSFEDYIPSKKKEKEKGKESPSFFYPKFRGNKNKFNINQTQSRKKEETKEEDYSEDEYSGLASKLKEKKEKKNFIKYSEDHNDFKTKWKTEMCHYWEMYGSCKYGNSCAFAHGSDELNKRKMSSNYKTKPCKQFFEIGYCTYGVRCQFSHKLTKEKEKKEIEIDKENKISYLKILKEFNDQNNLISHEIVKRPRLMTFEDITKSGKEMKEKNRLALYEDILEIKKKENEAEKVFSQDTNDEEEEDFEFNIDDYTYNENEENNEDIKEEKRERFISA